MNVAVPLDTLRPAAAPISAGLAAFAELGEAEWDALLGQALDPNPFHGRLVLTAHAAAGLLPERLRFIAVRGGARLEALLPYLPGGSLVGWRRAHRVWMPPQFAVNATPLIGRARPEESVEALVAAMAQAGRLWRLPLVALDGAAGRALVDACRRRGFATAAVSSFDRAVLARCGGGYEAYARRHLSAGRRKALARQWRRLGEAGRIAVASFTERQGLRDAVEAFLQLEAQGWKGRRGTALASRAATAAVGRALFTAAGAVAGRADVLSLDGRPVAISLALVSAGTAFLLKTAHDERLRAFSPGVLLEDAILRAFLDEGFAERLDSASLPGSLLDELYADRERIADLVVATDSAITVAALAAMVAKERRRQAVLDGLKAWYWRAIDFAKR
jgi:CelD/BcsL family acetyltransferase involved in cellulose biosynthesis